VATRKPLVLGADGLPQQLQGADTLPATVTTNANGTAYTFPDGAIEQFVKLTLVNGAVTWTFPIPFPNACLHVDPVPVVGGLAATTTINAWLASDPTKTQVVINGRSLTTVLGVLNLGAGSFDVKLHAIGN